MVLTQHLTIYCTKLYFVEDVRQVTQHVSGYTSYLVQAVHFLKMTHDDAFYTFICSKNSLINTILYMIKFLKQNTVYISLNSITGTFKGYYHT